MKRPALCLLAALLAGCGSAPTIYNWGSYESLVYARYAAPGKVAPEQEIGQLEKDRQQALATHRRMPPGWHAHLGALYQQVGKADQAQQEFAREKAEFPESAVFVDRMLANLAGPHDAGPEGAATRTAPGDGAP